MAGRAEVAVRSAVSPGDRLATPSGRGQFTVARYTGDGLVLLPGEKEARTPLPWQALEQVPDLLGGRGRVLIGSVYPAGSVPGSLDEHLEKFLTRATAGWVAAVLEKAGIIPADRARPARIRLPRSGDPGTGDCACLHAITPLSGRSRPQPAPGYRLWRRQQPPR
jgi:hypothetical protein